MFPFVTVSFCYEDANLQWHGGLPLFEFLPEDLHLLHRSLGDHLNLGFLQHTAFCILEQHGRFVEICRSPAGSASATATAGHACRAAPLENLAHSVSLMYDLAPDHAPLSSTIIPRSELCSVSNAASSSSISSSGSDLNRPFDFSDQQFLAETGLDLDAYAHMTVKQRRIHLRARQAAMREKLLALQQPASCRVTRKDIPELLEIAHLFRTSNPDQVSCASLLPLLRIC